MVSNKDISVAELARVFEAKADQTDLPEGLPPRRLWKAQCADGSICAIGGGGFLIGDTIFCYKHDGYQCEGCVRVLCVLTDEKLQKLKLSILGYTLKAADSKPSLELV